MQIKKCDFLFYKGTKMIKQYFCCVKHSIGCNLQEQSNVNVIIIVIGEPTLCILYIGFAKVLLNF